MTKYSDLSEADGKIIDQKVLELNAKPRKEIWDSFNAYRAMSEEELEKIPSIERYTYILWEANDMVCRRKDFFRSVKNLYKTKQDGEEVTSESIHEELKQIALEKINANYAGARMVVSQLPADPATPDHIVSVFQKARHHPLRPRTVESNLLIPQDIADKIAYVDYDSKERPFTGFIMTIANYYKKCTMVKSIKEAIELPPDNNIIQICPIDNDPVEYKCIGLVIEPMATNGEYQMIMLVSWIFRDFNTE